MQASQEMVSGRDRVRCSGSGVGRLFFSLAERDVRIRGELEKGITCTVGEQSALPC